MARRVKELELAGRRYRIREMDAFTAEEWALDAVGLVRSAIRDDPEGLGLLLSSSVKKAYFSAPEELAPQPVEHVDENGVAQVLETEGYTEETDPAADSAHDAPMAVVAQMGWEIFLTLPSIARRSLTAPLLDCCEYLDGETWRRVSEHGHPTEKAREVVRGAAVIGHLKAEAFKMHTDFFTPCARSVAAALALARQLDVTSKTSPAQ